MLIFLRTTFSTLFLFKSDLTYIPSHRLQLPRIIVTVTKIIISIRHPRNYPKVYCLPGIDSRKAEVVILGKLRAPFREFRWRLLFWGCHRSQ